ncbi:Hpt domain-containing protein [Parasphingopyxis lamellibrachiae]|uniref:Hpt domain-containing protein n=1 Tax=Parasphingopyxis lamellibrachiae TaxID=680125 RepID=A0A3D9FH73_9SPHN|nr:Hpt domain-containing protein [Parasphingopyxis lamellibrachiae]RED16436.1 Hpt domain-containing protein [Parasphingopyxis lamellibrachiae]
MSFQNVDLVDWTEFDSVREELGSNFARILRYYSEDGIKSVEAIEEAIRNKVSAALIVPAHTLKGESLQFGAIRVSMIAEKIEMTARHLVEIQQTPEELVPDAAELRPALKETMERLEEATNPLVQRHHGIDERHAANQKFGRL